MTDDKLGRTRAKELGLNMKQDLSDDTFWYEAEGVWKLLSEGEEYRFSKQFPTHQGLIIGIKPITPETREEKLEALLREIIDRAEQKESKHFNPRYKLNTFIDRAKALLERK